MIIVIIVHIGHINSSTIEFIDENISFSIANALSMDFSLDFEGLTEEVEQCISFYVGIKRVSDIGKYHEAPEEMYKNFIHEWKFSETLKHVVISLA